MGKKNRIGSREVETERVSNSLGKQRREMRPKLENDVGKGGDPHPWELLSPVCRLTGIIRW